MENSLQFLSRNGFGDPREVLRAARLGPYTSVADFAALPDSVIYSSGKDELTRALISARDLARESCGHCLDFWDERHGLFTRHVPGPVGGAVPASGRTFSESTRLTRSESTTGSGLNPLEHIASGHEVSAWDVEASFKWVFDEAAAVSGSITYSYVRPGGLRAYSFAERCRASGCTNLIPRVSLDEGIKAKDSRDNLPPTKRMRLARDELNSRKANTDVPDRRAARLPQNLALEASVRAQFASIKKSWRITRAGIASYAQFMNDSLPNVKHFPVSLVAFRLWANHFDNGDTLQNYASHLNFAHRILSLPEMKYRDIINSIIRGSRKDQTRRVKPRAVGPDLDRLVGMAISEGDLLGARAYVIAYSFLFRCGDELFNLQVDGRASDGDHHSHIIFEKKSPSGPASAAVHLTSRKNAPGGAVISRPCLCGKDRLSPRCGVCALIAVVHAHLHRGGTRSDRIFGSLKSRRASSELRRRGLTVGISRCSWHAFRRGAASDIVRSGGTIGFLMHQGGWKSAAFLKYLLASDINDRCSLQSAAVGLSSDSE